MKKGIAFILIFTHLFASVGFSMSIHYCGKNVSYKIGKLELNKHCKCKVESKASKCCKNEQVIVKADKKDKSSSQSRIQLPLSCYKIYSQPISYHNFNAITYIAIDFPTKAPPGITSPSFLKNHSFRI